MEGCSIEYINSVFLGARRVLEKSWGYQPTLSELVRLRHYSADCCLDMSLTRLPDSDCGYMPKHEAIARFMHDLYGYDVGWHAMQLMNGTQVREYIRLRQAKEFLL